MPFQGWGVVAGDWDFEADLGSVSEFPVGIRQERIDQQRAGLGFVQVHGEW